jgi:hypothetical protein
VMCPVAVVRSSTEWSQRSHCARREQPVASSPSRAARREQRPSRAARRGWRGVGASPRRGPAGPRRGPGRRVSGGDTGRGSGEDQEGAARSAAGRGGCLRDFAAPSRIRAARGGTGRIASGSMSRGSRKSPVPASGSGSGPSPAPWLGSPPATHRRTGRSPATDRDPVLPTPLGPSSRFADRSSHTLRTMSR